MKIDEAIAKITDEAMAADDPAVLRIEEYLTEICTSDQVADKLLKEGKTIKGALEAMCGVAKKKQKNQVACLTDEEGFQIVEEYFGITAADKKTVKHAIRRGNVINLEDLL